MGSATDFRLRCGVLHHPKIRKLRGRLGADAVLSWIQLLDFATSCHPDGRLTNMDAEDIALAGDWMGDGAEFVDALLSLRLLDLADGVYSIHDWTEVNPWAAGAAERSERARRAALARRDRAVSATCPEIPASSTQNGTSSRPCALHDAAESVRNVQKSPAPFLSVSDSFPNPNPEETELFAASQNPDSQPPPAPHRVKPEKLEWEPDDLWLREFLLREQRTFVEPKATALLDDCGWWADLSQQINGFDKAFLTAEFAGMSRWIRENHARAPTISGVRRFVSRWLAKAAEDRRKRARG